MEPAEYEAKLAALVKAMDYEGAAALESQQRLALESLEAPRENDDDDDAGASTEGKEPDASETEHSSSSGIPKRGVTPGGGLGLDLLVSRSKTKVLNVHPTWCCLSSSTKYLGNFHV
jgi:hypothetical protein